MIIQIQITDKQLAEYLELIGYKTEMVEVPKFRPAYHGRMEQYSTDELHVVLSDGSKKPAKEFFEKLIDETIINLLKNNKNGRN